MNLKQITLLLVSSTILLTASIYGIMWALKPDPHKAIKHITPDTVYFKRIILDSSHGYFIPIIPDHSLDTTPGNDIIFTTDPDTCCITLIHHKYTK